MACDHQLPQCGAEDGHVEIRAARKSVAHVLRVAVAGALGRMGRVACAAVAACNDLQLAGGLARSGQGTPLASAVGLDGDAGLVYGDIAQLLADAKPDVLVDFTLYPATLGSSRAAVDARVAVVGGASGWTDTDRASLAALCAKTATSAFWSRTSRSAPSS